MMRVLFCIACTLLLVACACHGRAASATPQLVKAMQEHYSYLQSFKADFTQKLIHQESGIEETRTGTIVFQRPLLLRWDIEKPEKELLLVTGKEVWNYRPADNTADRYALEVAEDSRSIIRVITGQSRLDEDFQVKENGRDGGLVKLTLYPKEQTMQFTEAQLWVDSASNMIRRAVILDFWGNRNDITLEYAAENPRIEPGTFTFSPPQGVRVEDKTRVDAGDSPLMR